MSLENLVDHIYNRDNVIARTDRPNLFIKELFIYIDYLKNKLEESKANFNKKEEKYLTNFTNNMKAGVAYYQHLFYNAKNAFNEVKQVILNELESGETILKQISFEIEKLSKERATVLI